MPQEFHFDWRWDLQSSPQALWPFAADTNRFNRDTGQPKVEVLDNRKGIKRLRMRLPVLNVEWEEDPFEWTYPYSFGVLRRYTRGPIDEMRVRVDLDPQPEGGTCLRYQTWIKTSNLLAQLGIPIAIGVIARNRFKKAFRNYDLLAKELESAAEAPHLHGLNSMSSARFRSLREAALSQGTDPVLITRLEEFLDQADELSVQRIRPYALADRWRANRRSVLEMFLRATRVGILDMSWDLLCPSCRGRAEGHTKLGDVRGRSHCDTCQIDFSVNFDHNIEVVFRPNSSVRHVERNTLFCVGSPQLQPHVVMVQKISALHSLPVDLQLEPGRYALRSSALAGSMPLEAALDGSPRLDLRVTSFGWPSAQRYVSLLPTLNLINATETDQNFQLERTAWSDQAATAADVTALQVFRDLFASEVIRPGEEISIGSVTLLFTDLRESTRLYRSLGDALAFGHVRDHFDVLGQAVAAEGGSIVKTMGDSIMATFRDPVAALRAVWNAQKQIAGRGEPALRLKAGIHKGPCIVVNLNDRLDYFGSTVNIAARLSGFSQDGEFVFTEAIYEDAGIDEFLAENGQLNALRPFTGTIQGFDEPFTMWKLKV